MVNSEFAESDFKYRADGDDVRIGSSNSLVAKLIIALLIPVTLLAMSGMLNLFSNLSLMNQVLCDMGLDLLVYSKALVVLSLLMLTAVSTYELLRTSALTVKELEPLFTKLKGTVTVQPHEPRFPDKSGHLPARLPAIGFSCVG